VAARKPKSEKAEIRDQRSREKYGVILRAAIRVFARSGFFGSKVNDVAREAGVADGTVYLYFKNKDDILVSIFDETMGEGIAEGRAAIEGIEDPRERLRRLAEVHLDRMGRDRDLAVVFQVELRQSLKFMTELSHEEVADYLNVIRRVVEEGQASGEFQVTLHPQLVAKAIFGVLDEMVTSWVLSDKESRLEELADPITDFILRGLI